MKRKWCVVVSVLLLAATAVFAQGSGESTAKKADEPTTMRLAWWGKSHA
jgi:ABC-type glycerol-3-phosphate transport system substrate-binding protein